MSDVFDSDEEEILFDADDENIRNLIQDRQEEAQGQDPAQDSDGPHSE